MRKRTVITEDIEGVDCELSFEPVEYLETRKARVGDMLVYGYLVCDDMYRDIDDLMGDCMGKLYSFHRHASKDDHSNGLAALGRNSDGEPDIDSVWGTFWETAVDRYVMKVMGSRDDYADMAEDLSRYHTAEEDDTDESFVRRALDEDARGASDWSRVWCEDTMHDVLTEMWNEPAYFPGDPDAVLLDCYDHGGQVWSISGGGMQCRWDTARGAGVWVPEYLEAQLDGDEKAGKDRAAQARTYCRQFLDQYNDISSGQVFGVVVEWFDEQGESIDNDSCWGHVGSDWAEESLKETFDAVCARLQRTYDEDVRTQCGKQHEMELV